MRERRQHYLHPLLFRVFRQEPSARMEISFLLCPLSPEPISDISAPTCNPRAAAYSSSLFICLSRSLFWSADDTRTYSATLSSGAGPGSGSWTSIVPVANCSAGPGNLPERKSLQAVLQSTPFFRARSDSFTGVVIAIRHQNISTVEALQATRPDETVLPEFLTASM